MATFGSYRFGLKNVPVQIVREQLGIQNNCVKLKIEYLSSDIKQKELALEIRGPERSKIWQKAPNLLGYFVLRFGRENAHLNNFCLFKTKFISLIKK